MEGKCGEFVAENLALGGRFIVGSKVRGEKMFATYCTKALTVRPAASPLEKKVRPAWTLGVGKKRGGGEKGRRW